MPKQLQKCPHCGLQLVPSPKEWKHTREVVGHMTQREMAKALGVKASHIAYIENGHRNPSGDLILKYMKLREELYKNAKKRALEVDKEASAEEAKREKAIAAARKNGGRVTPVKKPPKKKVAAPKKPKKPKKVKAVKPVEEQAPAAA